MLQREHPGRALRLALMIALALSSACAGGTSAGEHRTGREHASTARSGGARGPTAPEPRPVPPPPDAGVPAPTTPGRLAGRKICVDPGHEAYWGGGAAGRDARGQTPVHPALGIALVEHALTLDVAYRLAHLLELEGADVCVTRRDDGSLQIEPYDFTGDGHVRPESSAVEDSPERTQPRIDWANQFGAEILVSIHFNGSEDPAARGTEVYYSDTGPQVEQGLAFAEHVLSALLGALDAGGFPGADRGVRVDHYQRYPPNIQAEFRAHNAPTIIRNGFDPADCPDCQRVGILGNNPMSLHRASYLGVLVEVEFLSNPVVVEDFLLRPDSLDVIATGLANGVLAYLDAA